MARRAFFTKFVRDFLAKIDVVTLKAKQDCLLIGILRASWL
jgi:hypothetical protein